jgi:hypothetical protein
MEASKWGGIALIVAGACIAASAQAQNKPLQSWQPPRHGELDPAKRVPPAPPVTQGDTEAQAAEDTSWQARPSQGDMYVSAPRRRDDRRGGAFIGVSAGKGWVYDDVDQSAQQLSAGYRWQAGPVALLGVEVAAGKLSSETHDGLRYDAVDFASIGFNGRFNFGRYSPVYGLVRAGYWAADTGVNDGAQRADIDGGYFGVGLGADFGRHFSLSLVFTSYVYFNELYWEGDDLYYDANRADTLMFGGEFRF